MEGTARGVRGNGLTFIVEGAFAMTPYERAQLLNLAEEIILNLRRRFAEIENLQHQDLDPGVAEFQEHLCDREDDPKYLKIRMIHNDQI